MAAGEPVVAAHGVTANHRRWALLAGHRRWALLAGALAALDGRGTLVASDSRGRGASASIIGPFGIDAHADDLVAALDRIGASTQPSSDTPWAGSSPSPAPPATPSESGGSSSSTAGLLLGVEAPAETTVDDVLHAVLGPALRRLRRTFTNAPPTTSSGGSTGDPRPDIWTPEVEPYLDSDLVGEPPLLRSGVSLEAVRRDSQDTLGDSTGHALERWTDRWSCFAPLPASSASRRACIRRCRGRRPASTCASTTTSRRGTNHYSIVLGARGEAAVAAHGC